MADGVEASDVLAGFREQLYQCMTRRADALFELPDALLCTDGPVKTLVGLSLAPEHRRGHGAMYDALNQGRLDVESLRRGLAGLPLPQAADGRRILAVDVSPWLRPDGACSPQRSFCHTYGRGKDQHRMIPSWPYSVVVALEPGRTSWTALLDARATWCGRHHDHLRGLRPGRDARLAVRRRHRVALLPHPSRVARTPKCRPHRDDCRMAPGEWSATVTWSPWPNRPDTMTANTTDAWFAKRQARLWAQCPGAVSVQLSGPDGAVVAKWDRRAGWTT